MKIKYYSGNGIQGIVRHLGISFNEKHWLDIQFTPSFALWGFWGSRNYSLFPRCYWWQLK